MPIFNIPIRTADSSLWDMKENDFSDKIEDYESFVMELKSQAQFLHSIKIEDLLKYFDSLANYWMQPQNPFARRYSDLGIAFLINFLRRSNLESLLSISLRGRIAFLNDFQTLPEINKKIMAQPRGVITHWLSGNVPILGMISLVAGILSKNANIVKLPKVNGKILPSMISDLTGHKIQCRDGKDLEGKQLIESIRFIYCERGSLPAQRLLSTNTDVRVAWGGREAVELVLSLPKHYWTEDVIFGPKYSFAVVGRNSFNINDLDNIAYRLALDTSVFDQGGCNSPHTVFVEEGGEVSPLDFAKALARGMEKALKRIPRKEVSADEAYSVVNLRGKYELVGEVFSSKGTEWTVIYSEEEGLAEAYGSRIIFVRPIGDIYKCLDYIDQHKQTLGLMVDGKNKDEFAKLATAKGIERITDFGKMSSFDYPWDGIFPIERFVRWVSLNP